MNDLKLRESFEALTEKYSEAETSILLRDWDVMIREFNCILNPESPFPLLCDALSWIIKILMRRGGGEVRRRYLSSWDTFTRIVPLLNSPFLKVQLYAFEVFALFVVYPTKNESVKKALIRHADRFVEFCRDLETNEIGNQKKIDNTKRLVMNNLQRLANEEDVEEGESNTTASISPHSGASIQS